VILGISDKYSSESTLWATPPAYVITNRWRVLACPVKKTLG